MNTKLVNSAAGVINAALTQNRTAVGIALALDSAQMLMTPDVAAELVQLRARAAELESDYVAPSPSCTRCYGADAARFVAQGGATAPCPVCGPSEVELLRARVSELEAERHVTNEALSGAAEQLRANRDQIASLEAAQGAIPPLWVADCDSAPLTLHLTREAARAACDDVAKVDAHGRYWDWRTEEGDTDRQFWTHPDDDRPTGYTGGAVWQIEVEQPDVEADGIVPVQALREDEPAEAPALMVFRASHDSIGMGLYTAAAEARKHCETLIRREHADNSEVELWWREDEDTVDQPEDGEQELFEHVKLRALPGPGRTRNTGYVVTPLEVASEFDPDGDE